MLKPFSGSNATSSALSSIFCALNPEFHVPNSICPALNMESRAANSESRVPNSESRTPNSESRAPNSEFYVQNPMSRVSNTTRRAFCSKNTAQKLERQAFSLSFQVLSCVLLLQGVSNYAIYRVNPRGLGLAPFLQQERWLRGCSLQRAVPPARSGVGNRPSWLKCDGLWGYRCDRREQQSAL